MEVKAPRGTYDVLPAQAKNWYRLEEKAVSLFERYGYARIVTPTFEHTELFKRGIGESTDIVQKEMYTFKDKSGRSLTLRPEGTAPVVRAYLEHNLSSHSLPIKLYYLGSMFRYERPQAGRYREFWQVGVEAMGSMDSALDAEVILLLVHYLQDVGLKDLTLFINSMGCLECRPRFISELREKLGDFKELLCPDCKRRIEQNPLRVFDCKKDKCRKALREILPISDYLCSFCSDHFQSVQRFLREVNISFELNPWLVRGFDYYTRTTFEVVSGHLGAQNALGGGGRYDELVKEFGGTPTPAIGFAIGLERVLLALFKEKGQDSQLSKTKVFLAALGDKSRQKAFNLLYRLRIEEISADMDYQNRSLKSQMKLADKHGATFTLLLGSDELERGICGIRDMETGVQEEVSLDECVNWLKINLQKKEYE
jgi:histidyl-tRNA synthetase